MHPVRAAGLLFAVFALVGVLACADSRRTSAQPVPDEAPADADDNADDTKKKKTDAKDVGFADLGDLNAEVTILQVLHALNVTDAQLDRLATLAAKTMQTPPPRKLVKASDKYRKALRGLRDALVKSDDDKIDEAVAALDELSKKESPEFDDIELTANARKSAPALLRRFSTRQVVGYLGTLDNVPDPVEQVELALEQSRKLRGRAWQDERDATAVQVGWLIGGVDATAEKKVRARVELLLNRAAKLEDKAYESKRADLRKEARALVVDLGPTDVLRHFMERVLAETLSNHRLAAVVTALRKKK